MSKKTVIEYLSWDSVFFGKNIGKIACNDSTTLLDLLHSAKSDNYELVYLFGNENFYPEKEILEQFGGKLADKKVLFNKQITDFSETPPFVEKYEKTELTENLENLAYISGEFSRFKLDKKFRENDFYRMYKRWIENSLNKQMADNVFVVYEENTIKGMATLNISDGIGHIGLIAVFPDAQGRGFGRILLNACENELLAQNIFHIEVPTQANNPACFFYEKCGYVIKSITNIYHFWI
jgi:ribosomal protein S18 acetylase RimI-like enzyme